MEGNGFWICDFRRGLEMRGAGRSRTDDGGFAIRCLSHLATAPCPCQVKIDRPRFERILLRGKISVKWFPRRARLRRLPKNSAAPTISAVSFGSQLNLGCGGGKRVEQGVGFRTLKFFRPAAPQKVQMPESKRADESEEQLVTRAQEAVSQCRWVVGECAAKWTER